ncbi:MAG: zinc ribbon domain-containing protein [Chloroflexi bacterium]|nr:zinc ribbon domain-containing protein [Chloroflexota bacterium]
MPLYEYRCSHCGASFEKLVRFADADGQIVCPACGSSETKKQISMFGWSGGASGASTGGCVPAPSGGG